MTDKQKSTISDEHHHLQDSFASLIAPLPADIHQNLSAAFQRIIDDLASCLKQQTALNEIDFIASSRGQDCAGVAKASKLSFDDVFRLANKLRRIMRDCFFGHEHIGQAGSKGGESFSLQSAYLESFSRGFAKEWLKLTTTPYHKKLREANRYILHEKRRYYTIFNRMSEPAFIVDHDLRLVETNKAFERFFNLDGKKHIGKLCYEVLGAEVCSACSLEGVLDGQASFPGIEMTVCVNGDERHIIFSGTFLGDINSEFPGGIIILQDISQKKKVERDLLESEEKYRSLIENVPDVTWRADQDGHLSYISPNVEKICGFTPEEMSGGGLAGRFGKIHPDDIDLVRNEFGLFFASHLPSGAFLRKLLKCSPEALDDQRIIDGRKKYEVKYRFLRKDGTWIWLHDRATNIYEGDGAWFTDGVFSDITELKRAEDELELHHFRLAELVDERTSELSEANKSLKKEITVRRQAERELLKLAAKLKDSNDELEQFAYVASHDLKEPLMLITAFSERMVKRYSDRLDEKGLEYLRRIVLAVTQMGQLIDGLLELSRVTSCGHPFERVDLTEILQEVVHALEERIKESEGSIKFGDLGCLGADRVQIRQLFQNILVNALKYQKKGAKPEVLVRSNLVDDRFYEITVSDNGIGFEPCHVERIFKPLERLHGSKEYEGTGMGLATCQKIVLRHGGEITAKSKPGRGTTFIVRLPVKLNSE